MSSQVFIIKPGVVEYLDLCLHENVSRSEFFNKSDLKTLRWYGLILEQDELVKVFHNDDLTDDTEGAGIVIPRACVQSIVYFKEDARMEVPIVDQDDSVN